MTTALEDRWADMAEEAYEDETRATPRPSTVIAERVKFHEAKRAFERGAYVWVSEYGHEPRRTVTLPGHSRETTTWDELVTQVRMWRGRYPNQRFYVQ